MRIGLASLECKNRNVSFNMAQIERAMREVQGKVDLLCFREAYLQGFDSLCWDYTIDKEIASIVKLGLHYAEICGIAQRSSKQIIC